MENQEKEVVRPLHELYELLLERIEKEDDIDCICWVIDDLYYDDIISSYERADIIEHFKKNKPSIRLHQEFFNHVCFKKGHSLWWIYKHPESNEQRKLFIQKMIEITNPKQQ